MAHTQRISSKQAKSLSRSLGRVQAPTPRAMAQPSQTGAMFDEVTVQRMIAEAIRRTQSGGGASGAAAASPAARPIVVSRDLPEGLAAVFVSQHGVGTGFVCSYSQALLILFFSTTQTTMILPDFARSICAMPRIWRISRSWTGRCTRPFATPGRTSRRRCARLCGQHWKRKQRATLQTHPRYILTCHCLL